MYEILRVRSIKDPGFLPLLTQFLMEAGQGVPDARAIEQLEAAMRSEQIRFYVALSAGRGIGVVSLTLSFSTQRMAPYAVLSDLWVHPGFRGRGAASALLLAAMDGAHEGRCCYIVTESAEGMEGVFDRHSWRAGAGLMRYEVNLEAAPPSLTTTGEITFD